MRSARIHAANEEDFEERGQENGPHCSQKEAHLHRAHYGQDKEEETRENHRQRQTSQTKGRSFTQEAENQVQ